MEDGEIYDVDGPFIENLADFYGDYGWMLYDLETGEINMNDEAEGCEAAGNTDFDSGLASNTCADCEPTYLDGGLTMTYVIPVEPVAADEPSQAQQSGAGVAYSGVLLDDPAPVAGITGTYSLGPFDDCGGHVNPYSGYHHHAVTDCLTEAADSDDRASTIGIAMDGCMIYSRLNSDGTEPGDLDSCNGHASDELDYHYHAGYEGSNAIVGCLTAQAGCNLESDPDGYCDASIEMAPPGAMEE